MATSSVVTFARTPSARCIHACASAVSVRGSRIQTTGSSLSLVMQIISIARTEDLQFFISRHDIGMCTRQPQERCIELESLEVLIHPLKRSNKARNGRSGRAKTQMVDAMRHKHRDEFQVIFVKCKKWHGSHQQHGVNFAGRVGHGNGGQQLILIHHVFRYKVYCRQFSAFERGCQYRVVVVNRESVLRYGPKPWSYRCGRPLYPQCKPASVRRIPPRIR